MNEEACDIGMIGLGEMGTNLVLNIAEHGYSVAGYDRDPGKVRSLRESAEGRKIRGTEGLEEFAANLKTPRAVMMLVPAGPPVDDVIRELLPHLFPGDLLMDGGNSFFRDTDLRMNALSAQGILYLGVGISGGGRGARFGPSLMPGGTPEGYQRVRHILEGIAARAGGEPCVAYLGRDRRGTMSRWSITGSNTRFSR